MEGWRGAPSEWKRVQMGGKLRRRGNRKAGASNQMKLFGLNIMGSCNFRTQCERPRRLA
ncbi:MAG: hypothetical protein LBQ12_09820 [Deltaproteobacteria bacterium]|nr:hypothetical protein [Deltaproteobacteria bacterium]